MDSVDQKQRNLDGSEDLVGFVGIMGTPITSGNRGVLALGASLISLCSEAFKGSEIVLLIGNRNDQPAEFRIGTTKRLVKVVNARMSPRSAPKQHLGTILAMSACFRLVPLNSSRRMIANLVPWIKAVSEARLVGDIRGGDSFSDIYGMGRFMSGFMLALSVILVRGSLTQFPQTYGPYRRKSARFLARFLLRRSSTILARDLESQRIAQSLVGSDRKVGLSPDVAFSLHPVHVDSIIFKPPQLSIPELSPIGINVNGLMFNGGYTRDNMFGLKLDYPEFLLQLISTLLAHHPGDIWLVPHTYAPQGNVESDIDASLQIYDRLETDLRSRVRVVAGEYDCHELKGIIGRCDFFVGSRMHSCIAALSQGVPCVGVAYSMKFKGVFESVGMADWVVDACTHTIGSAVATVLERYAARNVIKDDLSKAASRARETLTEVFEELARSTALSKQNGGE